MKHKRFRLIVGNHRQRLRESCVVVGKPRRNQVTADALLNVPRVEGRMRLLQELLLHLVTNPKQFVGLGRDSVLPFPNGAVR